MPSFADMLGERQYVSQYATDPVGLTVYRGGAPGDADGNDVTFRMESLDGTVVVFERSATHTATGTYETLLSSVESGQPGLYKVTATYTIDGTPQNHIGIVEVGESNPAYDSLDVGMKAIVESVWVRFADLFDSPTGGPHLQVYFQTRFNRGRIAQLLGMALNRLNTIAQPHMTYSLHGPPEGAQFPYASWGGLLDNLTYIEAIKHLVRSYTEQPLADGITVSRLDRRDYMERWMRVLAMEQEDAKASLDVFKIAHMGLGRASVLVSGGVYGDYGPTRLPGSAAARPRYWTRWY